MADGSLKREFAWTGSAAPGADPIAAQVEELTAAFADDPLMTWLTPGERARRGFFRAIMKNLDPGAAVDTLPTGGVAVWIPSVALNTHVSKGDLLMVSGLVAAVGLPRIGRLARFGLSLIAHHPATPQHDYLFLLAVRPDARRQNLGSALLAGHLAKLDQQRRGAFLETANPANLGFYERHGFARRQTYRPFGGGPMLWTMWRAPPSDQTAS